MLSIFVMYSNDREAAFKEMLSFLRNMPLYESSQKTLVVDGRLKTYYEDWSFVEVPRVNNRFCWGRMWDAGVLVSKNDKIIYLDSDRLLPANFLEKACSKIVDDVFVFTSQHFMMQKPMTHEMCEDFIKDEDCFSNQKFLGYVHYDPRFKKIVHGPAKNVMSGSTGFTKKTYLRIRGVDHWYCGHGAYADTDFHYQASLEGCKFIDLGLTELHYYHSKVDDSGVPVSYEKLKLLSLDNFIRYCLKWNLPMSLAENVAVNSKIKEPKKYVSQRLKLLNGSPWNRFE